MAKMTPKKLLSKCLERFKKDYRKDDSLIGEIELMLMPTKAKIKRIDAEKLALEDWNKRVEINNKGNTK
jgi:hypothetical protein